MSNIERIRMALQPVLSDFGHLRSQKNEDMQIRHEQEAAELAARHAQEAADLAAERERDDRIVGAVTDALAATPR